MAGVNYAAGSFARWYKSTRYSDVTVVLLEEGSSLAALTQETTAQQRSKTARSSNDTGSAPTDAWRSQDAAASSGQEQGQSDRETKGPQQQGGADTGDSQAGTSELLAPTAPAEEGGQIIAPQQVCTVAPATSKVVDPRQPSVATPGFSASHVLTTFPAHSVVLAACSPVLETAFDVEDGEDDDDGTVPASPSGSSSSRVARQRELRLEVPAADLAAVERCFQFFYTGGLQGLGQREMLTCLMFGDRLQAPQLVDAAAKQLAELQADAMLLETAVTLISLPAAQRELFGKASASFGVACDTARQRIQREFGDLEAAWSKDTSRDAFLALPFEAVLLIVSNDTTRVLSENTACVAVSAWLHHQQVLQQQSALQQQASQAQTQAQAQLQSAPQQQSAQASALGEAPGGSADGAAAASLPAALAALTASTSCNKDSSAMSTADNVPVTPTTAQCQASNGSQHSKSHAQQLSAHLHLQHCSPSFMANVLHQLPVWPYMTSGNRLHCFLYHVMADKEAHKLTCNKPSLKPFSRPPRPTSAMTSLTFTWSVSEDELRSKIEAFTASGTSQHLNGALHYYAGYHWQGSIAVQKASSSKSSAAQPAGSYQLWVGLTAAPPGPSALGGLELKEQAAPARDCVVLLKQVTILASGPNQRPQSLGPNATMCLDGSGWGFPKFFGDKLETGQPAWQDCVVDGQLVLKYELKPPDT